MYIQASTVKRKGKNGRNRKLVEAYRDPETRKPRNRTVRKLEGLPILERARLIYRHGGSKHLDAEEWIALQQAGDLQKPEISLQVGDCYAGGGWAVLKAYLHQTGLEQMLRKQVGRDAGHLICEMIMMQILRPASKKAYSSSRRQTLGYLLSGKKETSPDQYYRSLDKLADGFESIRETLNRLQPPRSNRVLLYDLSNSYFCGQKAELGGYGHSKEKRHDRHIVSYGLVLSEDQMPLNIRVWKGGTADNQTVLDTFSQWKQVYQATEAVWVADRSMSDETTLSQIDEMGLSYVSGLPGSSQAALLESLHESQPDLFDQPLTEVNQDGKRYVMCRHQKKGYRRAAACQKARRRAYEGLKAIQQSPQNKNRDKLYHRAMKLLEQHKQTRMWSVDFDSYADQKGVTRWRLRFTLDRRAAQAADTIGHYYLLQTNLSGEAADKHEVQQHYKSLIMVERCFRMVKTCLEIRPIRHWKKRRIIAHIYLNYLCLWLMKYIENQWREVGWTEEVTTTLRRWDEALRYTELLDKDQQTPVDYTWTRGQQACSAWDEIAFLGLSGLITPKM